MADLTQYPAANTDKDNLPALARDYLIKLHATSTDANQEELHYVLLYLHELIAFDEKVNGD